MPGPCVRMLHTRLTLLPVAFLRCQLDHVLRSRETGKCHLEVGMPVLVRAVHLFWRKGSRPRCGKTAGLLQTRKPFQTVPVGCRAEPACTPLCPQCLEDVDPGPLTFVGEERALEGVRTGGWGPCGRGEGEQPGLTPFLPP